MTEEIQLLMSQRPMVGGRRLAGEDVVTGVGKGLTEERAFEQPQNERIQSCNKPVEERSKQRKR